MNSTTIFAFIAMTMLQGIIALKGRILAMTPKLPQGIFLSTTLMFAATYIFIALLSTIAPRWNTQKHDTKTTTFAALKTALALPLLLLFATVALRFHQPVPWNAPQTIRYISQAGFGFFYAATHWAFFAFVEEKRQAALYFAAFLGGVVCNELFNILNAQTYAALPPETVTAVCYSLVTLLMLALFVTLAQAFLSAWEKPGLDNWTGNPETANNAAKTLPMTGLLALMLVYYLMNALGAGVHLVNAPLLTRNSNFLMIALFACIAFPFFGRILAADLAKGVRWITAFAAIVSVMTPAFSAFTPDPAIYRPLHAAASASQWMFFLAMTVAMAQTVTGKWRMYAILIPYALRMFAILVQPVLEKTLFPHKKITLVAYIFAAIAFYLLASRFRVAPPPAIEPPGGDSPGESVPPPPPEPEPDPAALTAGFASHIDRRIRELADTYGFSKRETEIATLLARGKGGPDIAETLGLTLNTVNTYIRRIMTKCGGIRRREFIQLIFGKDERDDD